MQLVGIKSNVTFPWLSSARNDVAFFFAPAIFAILLTPLFRQDAVIQSPVLLFLILQGFAIGPFHQGLTWFQFLDERNLGEYRKSKNRFWAFITPILLIAATAAVYWFSASAVMFVYVLWTIQHIAKQNIGVLLLYHNYGQNEAVVPRDLECRSIETSSALFSFLFLNGFVSQTSWSATAIHLLIALLSVELAWLIMRFSTNLLKQVRDQHKLLNVPALAVWIISCLAFLPFAAAKDYGQGLFVALIIHWFQYIGINAILARRKYDSEASKRMLIGSQPAVAFCAVGMLFVMVSLPVQLLSLNGIPSDNWALRILAGVVYGMTLSHYFLDAFIWRFREPFNRSAILDYLKPRPEADLCAVPTQARLSAVCPASKLTV